MLPPGLKAKDITLGQQKPMLTFRTSYFCGERQKIDGNVVEEVQRPKTTPDLPKSLIPNSKNQVFIQHDHFQVFLNFFFMQESRLHTNTVENHSQNTT